MAQLFKLAKHQTYASNLMDTTPQLALFYEAGTGKTMCILDYLYRAFKHGEIENALVICPAAIVSSWESSIDKMVKFSGYTQFGVNQMKKMVTIRSFQRTYERKVQKVKHRNGNIEEKKVLKIRSDINHEWGAIIIDESQGLGDHSSVQTKTCLKLAEMTERRFILSGTPVSGGGGKEDFKKLYGQLKFLDPDVFPSWKDFCVELVTGYDHYNKPNSYRVAECRALMQNYGIVARLNDCYDMPDSIDTMVDIPLDEESAHVYEDIRSGYTDPYNFELKSGGVFYIKLLELVSGFLLDQDKKLTEYPTNKLDAVKEIITNTDDKVVIFCNYRHSIDKVAGICAKYGKTVIFDGRSTKDTWREFQFGDARYLVCHYQSGGVGIDLYTSHTMIFFEPSLSSLLMEQAKARTRRKGQTQKCLYYWLQTKGTVEAKTVDSVKNGVDVTKEMLEQWAKERGKF